MNLDESREAAINVAKTEARRAPHMAGHSGSNSISVLVEMAWDVEPPPMEAGGGYHKSHQISGNGGTTRWQFLTMGWEDSDAINDWDRYDKSF